MNMFFRKNDVVIKDTVTLTIPEIQDLVGNSAAQWGWGAVLDPESLDVIGEVLERELETLELPQAKISRTVEKIKEVLGA